MKASNTVRLIAFYLPQYHPIPENDEWWGKGFTEWTNVAKAKPLFKGHYQPHLPADLGFYDLRVPEVREQQAELAWEAGIEGFCYWHYWFAGKQLLERPFNEVLASGKPDFPFCLAWANQTWTGIWHGAPGRILIEQTYPGEEDHIAHFNTLLPAFFDDRYIKVNQKPLFLIYSPLDLPNPSETIALWQELAVKSGLKGLHIVGVISNNKQGFLSQDWGYDGFTISNLSAPANEKTNIFLRVMFRLFGKKKTIRWYQSILNKPYHVYDFEKLVLDIVKTEKFPFEYYPCVFPSWDNTPRSGLNGYVGINDSPNLFKQQMVTAIQRVEDYDDEHKMIFIKSWNEWAEGNYLEPDMRYGHGYLEAIREILEKN